MAPGLRSYVQPSAVAEQPLRARATAAPAVASFAAGWSALVTTNEATDILERLARRGHDLARFEALCGLDAGAFSKAPLPRTTLALLRFIDEDPQAALRLLTDKPIDPMPPLVSDTAMGLFESILLPLEAQGMQLALTGARAMALHGAARDTIDVDVFAAESARNPLLARLSEGPCRVAHVAADHFIVRHEDSTHPADRIDLMFPLVEPALSALPLREHIAGLPVIPALHLTVAKLMAPGASENADAFMLLDAAAADPEAVTSMLRELIHAKTSDRFRARLEDAKGGLYRLAMWRAVRTV